VASPAVDSAPEEIFLPVGHAKIVIGGRGQSHMTARADVLLFLKQQPIAVLELRRPGHAIVSADREPGKSSTSVLLFVGPSQFCCC
jgi:hypothetical protein